MNISYKKQYFLSLIPIIGIIIVWQIASIKVKKVTKNVKYIFLVYFFTSIPFVLIGVVVYFLINIVLLKITSIGGNFLIGAMAVIASIMMAISIIISEKIVINLYDKKQLKQKERELL